MNTTLKNIAGRPGAWLAKWMEARRRAHRLRKFRMLQEEAESVVNVMEYEGRLWLTIFGDPVFREEDIKSSMAEAVENARSAWVLYRMNENTTDLLIPDTNAKP